MCCWDRVDEYLLIAIFDLLDDLGDLKSCLFVNHWWCTVGQSDILWRRRLIRRYHVSNVASTLPPPVKSWRLLFKQMHYQTPVILDQQMKDHYGHVADVCISPNGSMIATVGKEDATLYVYEVGDKTCDMIFEEDLTSVGWNSALRCEFSKNSAMIAVSGLKKPDLLGKMEISFRVDPEIGDFQGRTLGEIIVFSLNEDFDICARINCKPADATGCWYNNSYIVSSDFKWLSMTNKVSASMLWMNKITKARSEARHDYTLSCMRSLFKFYNFNGNAVRDMLVMNVAKPFETKKQDPDELLAQQIAASESVCLRRVNVEVDVNTPSIPPHVDEAHISMLTDKEYLVSFDQGMELEVISGFALNPSYHEVIAKAHELGIDEEWIVDESDSDFSSDDSEWEYYDEEQEQQEEALKPEFLKIDDGFEVINEADKLLIFTSGSIANVPHQVGIRKMHHVRFRKHMDFSKSLKDRVEERRRRKEEEARRLEQLEEEDLTDWSHYPSISHMFDHIDIIFDFKGRVVGFAPSNCSRFLYVTYRPWPKDFVLDDQLTPPPAGGSLNCSVIDLTSFEVVGQLEREQSLFISNKIAYPAPPSVTKDKVLISSGHDATATIYDRHFGVPVAQLGHDTEYGKVTAVSVSSAFQDFAVTADDVGTVCIWKSLELFKMG